MLITAKLRRAQVLEKYQNYYDHPGRETWGCHVGCPSTIPPFLFSIEKKLFKKFFHSLLIIQGVGMYVHSTESKKRMMMPCIK